MADRDNMSVDQMLAACRKADGDGASESAPAPAKPAAEATPAKETAAPAAADGGAKPAGSKSAGAMSVAEMMAAARASDSGGGKSEAKAEPKEAAAKPAAAAGGKTPSKTPGKMSVAEMMAAARGEKSGGGAATKEKTAAKAKPAAKAKAPAKTPAAEKAPSGPKDTQSILAAARKTDKSGPMSKSEAAAREKSKEKEAAQPADARKSPTQAPPMPEKPAYARPMPARVLDDDETRRGFFGLFLGSYLAVGFTSLGLVNLLFTLGFARFMFPNILTEPPTKFKVGPPGNFAPGAVETKFKAQFGVWIVNTLFNGAQIIFALKTVCTHLGCTPNWLEAEQKFKCPCHGSGFYKDGINFEGPAPRPLERYAIRKADDGQLEVDKSKLFQEEKGQWTDGNSYVPV